MITTITGKNQITLPADLVRELDWRPGHQIVWTKADDGSLVGRRKPTRSELARKLGGRGRKYLTTGSNPVAELVAEREREDGEEGLG
ncbi:MAG: AbrB/MazE/SpoVT family DNA-binding domain-containing protein [Verrucomicrobiae bacterium]|nr:AbrB/MazE/SpoVT family DNA-binding domain-containing protein [Verrucomicrobiae bacterium]